ncbi:MAG: hypothetical protein KGD59_01530 [Candidatus Heimdallarchaeota archaeon]|nr:hypothetical protein [Candidatus Heimdallarchaeota archaeon]MBY8993201.1 hypothetical protein [Candidatus Heimdallarchaeota archaeon]
MNNENTSEKKSKAQVKLKQIGKSLGIGIIEGGITAGIGYLLLRLHVYTMFSILLIWLIFGWFSSYIINNNALEILTVMISGNVTAGLIYFFVGIEIWFLSLIIGLSILFWMISFTTKILLYPTKKTQDEVKELENNGN